MEAAGVEPAYSIEYRQVVRSVNARIGAIFRNAKSTVRSLYSPFPEIQQVPKLHLRTAPLSDQSILKCARSISQPRMRLHRGFLAQRAGCRNENELTGESVTIRPPCSPGTPLDADGTRASI